MLGQSPEGLDELCEVCHLIYQTCLMSLLAAEGAQTLTAQQCAEIYQMRRRGWPDPAKYEKWLASLPRAQVTA